MKFQTVLQLVLLSNYYITLIAVTEIITLHRNIPIYLPYLYRDIAKLNTPNSPQSVTRAAPLSTNSAQNKGDTTLSRPQRRWAVQGSTVVSVRGNFTLDTFCNRLWIRSACLLVVCVWCWYVRFEGLFGIVCSECWLFIDCMYSYVFDFISCVYSIIHSYVWLHTDCLLTVGAYV